MPEFPVRPQRPRLRLTEAIRSQPAQLSGGYGAWPALLASYSSDTRHPPEEYRAGALDGFGYSGYSWFCDLYRGWAGRLKPTMRQTHVAGEKLFVDFAGWCISLDLI